MKKEKFEKHRKLRIVSMNIACFLIDIEERRFCKKKFATGLFDWAFNLRISRVAFRNIKDYKKNYHKKSISTFPSIIVFSTKNRYRPTTSFYGLNHYFYELQGIFRKKGSKFSIKWPAFPKKKRSKLQLHNPKGLNFFFSKKLGVFKYTGELPLASSFD